MGGHYGAIHVRTDDQAAVRAGVEALSTGLKLKFYIGPPLRGWIGIYPAGNGQDPKVSAALAKKLDADMLHLMVHDDSVFAYVFYQKRAEADRYDSCPRYFSDDVPEAECRATEGKPELFQHLLIGPHTVTDARELLRRRDLKEEVFVRDRAVHFAKLFAIPNAIEAYEYMKQEETEKIEQWKKFIHIPDLKAEQQDKRRAKEKVVSEIASLKHKGLLYAIHSDPDLKKFGIQTQRRKDGLFKGLVKVAFRVASGIKFSAQPFMASDVSQNRLLIAWGIFNGCSTPLLSLASPWTQFNSAGLNVSANVHKLAVSSSGRFIAVGCASGDWNTELHDLKNKNLIKRIAANRVVSWVGFTGDEKSLLCVSESKWELISTSDGTITSCGKSSPSTTGHALLRSDGNLMLETDGKVGLFDLASGTERLTFYIGGKYSIVASIDNSFEYLMKKVDEQLEKSASGEELAARRKIAADYLKTQLNGTRQRLESAMKKTGGGKVPDRDTGTYPAFALEFNSDESQLFVATHSGCMVFDWSEIRQSANPKPRTVITPRSSDDLNFGACVYSLAFDASKNILLMGGNGKLHYYDVASGKTGVLLTPPAPAIFKKLCLSPDRAALACVCHFASEEGNRNARPAPELQIWNYQALLKEADLIS